jgi:purine-nucleoside phosphorylase
VPIHLRPSAPIAADALLPGDPGAALALAQEILTEPRMSNHSRGLWGYHGRTPDGCELTIQATGIGGPSAAIVLHELAGLGVERAIRVGECEALDPGLEPGAEIVASEAIAIDRGAGPLEPEPGIEADPELTAGLSRGLGPAAPTGAVASSGDFYAMLIPGRLGPGALALDLETAAVLATADRLGIRAGCALGVAGVAGAHPDAIGDGARADDDARAATTLRIGRVAAAALAQSRSGTGNRA